MTIKILINVRRKNFEEMNYVYGALLLHKSGKEVNATNLKKVVEATGTDVDEAKVKVLVESLKGVDIDKELEQAVVSAPAPEAKPAEAEKKKEEKVEEAAEGLSALFG